MQRRSGFTLAECLIAIFVLSIGLMGILALFPLGAMHMAQAIKDDRCGTSESNATAAAHWLWKDQQSQSAQFKRDPLCRNDSNPFPNGQFNALNQGYPYCPMVGPNAPIVDPDQPNGPNAPPHPPINSPYIFPGLPALTSQTYNMTLPSYPVFVDSIGWNANQFTPQQWWVGGNQLATQFNGQFYTIPRRSLQAIEFASLFPVIPNSAAIRSVFYNRSFVLLDDLGFGPEGAVMVNSSPQPPGNNSATPWGTSSFATTIPQYLNPVYGAGIANNVQRDGRYSTAWMIRRPQASLDSQAELTVVVYSGRNLSSPAAETVITGTNFQMNRNSTEVLVDWSQLQAIGQGKPKLRKGNWILDGTMFNISPQGQFPEPHGYFYRIIGVTDLGGTQMSLELQLPSLRDAGLASNGGAGNPAGLLIIMENVAEVFERKTLSPTIAPGQ